MREVHVVAARQHGLVTTPQLHGLGFDKSAISRWAAAGRLHRIYRGVYAVGHTALSREARWKAATLACGEESVLSHRSAAELWRLVEPREGDIEVTVQQAGGRVKRDGLRIHRVPSLPLACITEYAGIPVTRPHRTLLDLRGRLEPGDFRRAVREAEVRGLSIDASSLVPDRTTSELERRFLALCHRHRLAEPEVNVIVAGLRVDFLWRGERLVVETDGYAYHRGAIAFNDDRARDARLAALGFEVLRFTWRQVVHERSATAALVRDRLRARREALA